MVAEPRGVNNTRRLDEVDPLVLVTVNSALILIVFDISTSVGEFAVIVTTGSSSSIVPVAEPGFPTVYPPATIGGIIVTITVSPFFSPTLSLMVGIVSVKTS